MELCSTIMSMYFLRFMYNVLYQSGKSEVCRRMCVCMHIYVLVLATKIHILFAIFLRSEDPDWSSPLQRTV